jgi:hypothetical protein
VSAKRLEGEGAGRAQGVLAEPQQRWKEMVCHGSVASIKPKNTIQYRAATSLIHTVVGMIRHI